MPTRELSIQVSEVIQVFLEEMPQLVMLQCTGGYKTEIDVGNFKSKGLVFDLFVGCCCLI